jgi:hypothetical protein
MPSRKEAHYLSRRPIIPWHTLIAVLPHHKYSSLSPQMRNNPQTHSSHSPSNNHSNNISNCNLNHHRSSSTSLPHTHSSLNRNNSSVHPQGRHLIQHRTMFQPTMYRHRPLLDRPAAAAQPSIRLSRVSLMLRDQVDTRGVKASASKAHMADSRDRELRAKQILGQD